MDERERVEAGVQGAVARSAVYRILGLGFSYPGPEVLGFLKGGFTHKLAEAVSLLAGDDQPELAEAVEGLGSRSPKGSGGGTVGHLGEIEGEYNRLFRTGLLCTPYETEYDPMRSVRKGQELADILGFYSAFGLGPSQEQKELPDHIGVELEFMGFLLQKEAYARLNGWSEKVEVCTDAQRKFLREHLGVWVFAFCDRLEETSGSKFYRSLAKLLRKFMEHEIKALGGEPLKFQGVCMPSEGEACVCPFSGCEPD
jgi:DMSO reductase family type II enzyme chaperone